MAKEEGRAREPPDARQASAEGGDKRREGTEEESGDTTAMATQDLVMDDTQETREGEEMSTVVLGDGPGGTTL
eukprot:9383709-Ditylum_brightwellii.AAC.1